MHPELLRSVIKKQAGSLGKAILEGAMNSIDADATTVNIDITPTHVRITDDGRGFRDATEVQDFFATFGTPHQEGDSVYGQFRMGRGQMFAFGKNIWHTGEFIMNVDINEKLGFDLLVKQTNTKGCNIAIELYEPISQVDIASHVREVKQMLKYAPVPIFVNNERVSQDINPSKFKLSTDDAWISLDDDKSGIEVYNLGVYVCTLSAWQYGTGGVIISKERLDVNFARNQVLGSCKVWKRIIPLINKTGKQKVTRKQVLNEAEQENVINRLVSGDMRWDEARTIRFIKDTTGKAWSPNQIQRAGFEAYTVAPIGDVFGDTLMQTKRAFVVAKSCAELFEREDSQLLKGWYGMPAYRTLDALTATMDATGEQLPSKEWRKAEIAWVHVIRTMMYTYCGSWFRNDEGEYVQEQKQRKINIGTSQVALAWTDGETFVTFAREFLAELKLFKNGAPNIEAYVKVAHVLVHEMCHDTDSRENIHSPDFYRNYHDSAMKMADMVAKGAKEMTAQKYKRITGEFDPGMEPEALEPEPDLVMA